MTHVSIPAADGVGGSSARQRDKRLRREAHRTRDRLCLLISADRRLKYGGPDHEAIALATRLGFADHELNICRVALANRTVSLIIAPARVWHSHVHKRQLFYLKARLQGSRGSKVILATTRQLRKQPRLENAEILESASRVALTATERTAIELFVTDSGGGAPLIDCARQIAGHPDPVGAVLNLVTARRLEIEVSRRPIGPYSIVHAVTQEG